MMKFLKFVLFLALFAADFALADGLPNLDRTDKVHSRRYLDSLNAFARRPIRLNQSGYRPQDYKYAYVADPADTKFRVIDANSGAEAWSGSLSLISSSVIKPNIWINGAFNSLESVYEFGKQDSISTEREALYRAEADERVEHSELRDSLNYHYDNNELRKRFHNRMDQKICHNKNIQNQ